MKRDKNEERDKMRREEKDERRGGNLLRVIVFCGHHILDS